MEHASYFQYKGSHNPFTFERVPADARASEPSDSSMDFVSACNPRKRDRAAFESDDSARGLGLTDLSESSKRQRFGNFSVTEVDQVFERVILWLAANANSDRLPRTLVELEQAIQFINGFKASVDPECVFYHLVLNDFLRVSDDPQQQQQQQVSRFNPPSYNNNNASTSGSYSSFPVCINPYPANFDGSFLIAFPNAGLPNSLSGCSRVSQDFVTALNKAVTWLRSSLQLPSTKQGFTTALSQRDIVRVSYGGVLEYNTVPQADGQRIPVLQAPTFYTAAPVI
jgi:hypothetical protein